MFETLSQGDAEDVVLQHYFNAHVIGCPTIGEEALAGLYATLGQRWSVNVFTVRHYIQWEMVAVWYPRYIQEQRAPDLVERLVRDAVITERWMSALTGG